jgi:YHS domain-containing protein
MKKTATLLILSILTATTLFAAPGKQKICPVTGDSLGGDMGPPISYTEGGKTILFCCKSCVKKYKANPQKYASAMNKALAGS